MIEAIENYFESLANSHVGINSFVKRNLQEVELGLSGGEIKFPCLVLENFDWQLSGLKNDNPSRIVTGAFHIVDQVRNSRKFDAYKLAETVCDPIASQIINKLLKEEYSYIYGDAEHPIKFIDGSIQGLFLGKNFYSELQAGVRYEIRFAVDYDTKINEAVWQ